MCVCVCVCVCVYVCVCVCVCVCVNMHVCIAFRKTSVVKIKGVVTRKEGIQNPVNYLQK